MSRMSCTSVSRIAGLAIAVLLIMTASRNASGAAPARPNILFCLADNHSWLHVSAMGNRAIKTPSFDRIASEGIAFTNAFSPSSITK